jgi:hypothetical protein
LGYIAEEIGLGLLNFGQKVIGGIGQSDKSSASETTGSGSLSLCSVVVKSKWIFDL